MNWSKPPILCVDDEEQVLKALSRLLQLRFSVHTATGGEEGLRILGEKGPFAVVVSDMRMPNMNGIQFLEKVRQAHPDTVRILLTGQADLKSTISAINQTQIFRFLSKPCEHEILARALDEGVRQYRLIVAERELLQHTLRGSIKLLTDILSLVHPEAFGKAVRFRKYIVDFIGALDLEDSWAIEIAPMLSQLGCFTLHPELVKKLYHYEDLDAEDLEQVGQLFSVTDQMLANIPRLEPVREILAYQTSRFDGSDIPHSRVKGKEIPTGARILKIVTDFDDLLARKRLSVPAALDTLRGREGAYDPELLGLFCDIHGRPEKEQDVRELRVQELTPGMVIDEDVRAQTGTLLIVKGQEVTESVLKRIYSFHNRIGIREPIRTILKTTDEAGGEASGKQLSSSLTGGV
ncbi:MAG: response regulator [Candidatus Eisenbacteria bacterium]|nr:response regulator [Candidatus Eisenbacteria bacterium]